MKLLFDDTMAHLSRGRSLATSHDNAWETLRLRIANEAQTVSHLAELAAVTAGQTGATANEQTVSAIRTAAGDAVAAAAYPANRAVDTATATVADAAAGIATANEAVSAAVANFLNSLTALLAASTGKGAKQASS